MLKMMEGFLSREQIKWTSCGTHKERLEALKEGKLKAVSLQEPWISVAEKQGCRVLIESHSTRSEAAGDELDGPTKDLKLSRLLNAPPAPYMRERFDDNYQWTLSWGLVSPGATYENTVDNRAWQ
jgi:hypothetical protein